MYKPLKDFSTAELLDELAERLEKYANFTGAGYEVQKSLISAHDMLGNSGALFRNALSKLPNPK